ncbi:MAG: MoaD/ThiS family protein [Chromatiaceae bacterium]|jgi:molybdopterin converting factor small subunit|nr:MoaD/ThiS family protein [Chromatiaceae bacterium]
MTVKLKLYATLSDLLPAEARTRNELALDVPVETTVSDLIEQYRLPSRLVHLVLLNGHYQPPKARDARTLSDGDVLAIWPPVAGG